MNMRFRRMARGIQLAIIPILAIALVGSGVTHTQRDPARLRAQSHPMVLIATIDTSSSTVGIADSGLYFMDAEELTVAMEQLQSLGITQIRVFLPWRAIETSDDTYDWTQADLLLDTAASYGIAVVAAVTSSPTWASDYGGLVANGEPNSSTAYADFVGALAERYGTATNDGDAKISAYEIWNEPNGFTGWYPEPDAEQYTALLQAAYTAIKAVDPDATVIAGALGTGISIGTLTVNPVTFLTEMYAAGAAGYFDALSFHPYNYTSMFSEGISFANSAIKQLAELREIMDAHGDSDLLIWVTEYGQPSTQVSEANQAAYIADFLAAWSELTGVGPAFLYSLIDTATGSATAEDNLGLFTDDWTAKAVVEVIKAWIAGQPVTVDPGESSSGNSVSELLSALARAAQSFITAITEMVLTPFNGIAQFVQGVVDAVVGLISTVSGAKTSATTTTPTDTTVSGASDTADRVDTVEKATATEDDTPGLVAQQLESDDRGLDATDIVATVASEDVDDSVVALAPIDVPATDIVVDVPAAVTDQHGTESEAIEETIATDPAQLTRPFRHTPGQRRPLPATEVPAENAAERRFTRRAPGWSPDSATDSDRADRRPERPSDRHHVNPVGERPDGREPIRRPPADRG